MVGPRWLLHWVHHSNSKSSCVPGNHAGTAFRTDIVISISFRTVRLVHGNFGILELIGKELLCVHPEKETRH